MQLCGHGTLACAYVIFNCLEPTSNQIVFQSPTETLLAKKAEAGRISLDFPRLPIEKIETSATIVSAIGLQPQAVYRSTLDYLIVVEHEEQIISLKPNYAQVTSLDLRGIIVTAPAPLDADYDFVSRYFASRVGVPFEDPVTGSAHCVLTPYWSNQLNQTVLKARQLSKRGGELLCEIDNDRVSLSGHAVLYLIGEITV